MLERNAIRKDPRGKLRVALVYPNRYAAGMANLGYQMVYDLINSMPHVYAERFFTDAERSIETSSQLREFDLIAFSWQFEADALNILGMLRRGGIPIHREKRRQMVLVGGPCAVNPLPLGPFVDAFLIGEAEAGLLPFVERYRELRSKEPEGYSDLAGYYFPALENRTRRVYAKDLDDYYPTTQVMTPGGAFGEAFLLEVARGCGRGCYFCLGGYTFRPKRERSLERLEGLAEEGIKANRPEKIVLLGPSVADHPRMDELCAFLSGKDVGLSIPSLRADTLTEGIVRALVAKGQRTLTMAPESSEGVRCRLNKGLADEEILGACRLASRHGMRNVKLYIMLGCGEAEEDIREIAALVEEVRGTGLKVRLSVNPFVPKAHTPLQWSAFEGATMGKRLKLLGKAVKGVEMEAESPREAYVQAAIARGDGGLAPVLARSLDHGGGYSAFRRAAREEGIDLEEYTGLRHLGKPLPWSRIDAGARGLERLYRRFTG